EPRMRRAQRCVDRAAGGDVLRNDELSENAGRSANRCETAGSHSIRRELKLNRIDLYRLAKTLVADGEIAGRDAAVGDWMMGRASKLDIDIHLTRYIGSRGQANAERRSQPHRFADRRILGGEF